MTTEDAFMQEVGGVQETPEVAVEPQVAPEPTPAPQPYIPQFDPNILVGALDNVHSRLDALQQQTAPQPAQPTDEDMILKEVANKLGLDKVQQENAQLKQMLEQMQGQSSQMQEFIQRQQIEQAQNSILSKYDGITKDMVYAKLDEIAQQYGEEFATSLNNTNGWNYVISQIQKPPAQPDPIVSSSEGSSDFIEKASERVSKGQYTQDDLDALLTSFAK